MYHSSCCHVLWLPLREPGLDGQPSILVGVGVGRARQGKALAADVRGAESSVDVTDIDGDRSKEVQEIDPEHHRGDAAYAES